MMPEDDNYNSPEEEYPSLDPSSQSEDEDEDMIDSIDESLVSQLKEEVYLFYY